MRQVSRIVLALLAVVALAAACGDDGDEGDVAAGGGSPATSDPDTAVSSPPQTVDGTAPDEVVWARVEPTEDLVSPVVATPDELVPDPEAPDAVLVRFYGGVQECYGARATVVEQGPDEVRIRLETGSLPDLPPDTACIELAQAQELQVTLDAPVGDRTLTPVTS